MKLAVVGQGMIGAAATRHLAEAGFDVTLVGTGEPASYANHDGVFSSHYDSGRITRGLDAVPFWSEVSRASISRYRRLEAATGVRFYEEVGLLMTGLENGRGLIGDVVQVAENAQLECDYLRGDALVKRFPYFAFEAGILGLHEPANAGYINPREMVRAQLIAARVAGAKLVDGVVDGIDESETSVALKVGDETLSFERVMLATGGFSEALLGDLVPLRVFARTVALFPLDEPEQARLQGMPSHIALPEDGRDPYLLPPIRYPDGKVYLKMGGDPDDVLLPETSDVKEWFRSGGSREVGVHLEEEIRSRIPELQCGPRMILPCVTTFTDDELPAIKHVSGRVCVAVGGNGKGAKNSDELGRLGAELLVGQNLPGL